MGVKRFKHRLREGIKADRTACINRIRGLLAEFGLVFPTVDDFKQFRNGAQFGAWIGLTPRQHSSGGKAGLGGITKNARILWAVMTRGEAFDANHLSVKPQGT